MLSGGGPAVVALVIVGVVCSFFALSFLIMMKVPHSRRPPLSRATSPRPARRARRRHGRNEASSHRDRQACMPSCGHPRAYPRPAARPPQYPDYGLEPDIVVPGYWGLYDFEYKFNLSLLAGVCFFVALLGRVILVCAGTARQQPMRRNPRLQWIMGV